MTRAVAGVTLLVVLLAACTTPSGSGAAGPAAPASTPSPTTTGSPPSGARSPSPAALTTASGPCVGPVIGADVDGDGRSDRIRQEYTEQGPQITVCTAAGDVATLTGVGQGEVFDVVVLPDRPGAIVEYGATTALAAYSFLAAWQGGALVAVSGPDGAPLELARGTTAVGGGGASGQPRAAEAAAWGCVDGDGDGRVEIAMVRATRRPPAADATSSPRPESEWEVATVGYRLDGASAREVWRDLPIVDVSTPQDVWALPGC